MLEKVAINDVLQYKAARLCELKIVGASRHQRLNFNGSIYLQYAVRPYSVGTVIMASVYGMWIQIPARLIFSSSGIYSFVVKRTVTKLAVFAPHFLGGGVNPQIFDMHLQICFTCQHVAAKSG